jgi:hypothetical protein
VGIFEEPESLDYLKLRIETEIRNTRIPQHWLTNTIEGFTHRLHYCQEVIGEQFQHVL